MDPIFDLSHEEVTSVTQEILENLYGSKQVSTTTLEPHIIQAAKEEIKKLITINNYDMTRVADSLHSKGWDQDKLKIFIAELEKRKTELLYTTLIHHNSRYGDTIVDFDWILKLVIGTNDLKSLNYPLLQLILSTVSSKGEQKDSVYDINKEMLGKIINLLENVEGI